MIICKTRSAILDQKIWKAKTKSFLFPALLRRQWTGLGRFTESNPAGLLSMNKTLALLQYSSDASVAGETEKDSKVVTAPSCRFLPMTRKTLCRQLLEDNKLYAMEEHIKFQDLATGLDSAISRGFHGTLGEIKV